jgi:hypothetical protein
MTARDCVQQSNRVRTEVRKTTERGSVKEQIAAKLPGNGRLPLQSLHEYAATGCVERISRNQSDSCRSASVAVRARALPEPEPRRAMHQITQAMPPPRRPQGQTGGQLSRSRHNGHDPILPATSRSVTQGLNPRRCSADAGGGRDITVGSDPVLDAIGRMASARSWGRSFI